MKLRLWSITVCLAGWLDDRIDRDWTWRLWLWAVRGGWAAEPMQLTVATSEDPPCAE